MALFEFQFTPRAREVLPDTHFGLLIAHDIDLQKLAETLKPIRKETQQALAMAPAADVAENLQAFEAYFRSNGHESPLRSQRAHFQKGGIPGANPIVTLLLLAELRTGVLIGVQNARAIRPPLKFDAAAATESYEGLRHVVHCRLDEPVLRDAHGIIASLFQGPDKRTRVENESRDLAAFVFGVPGRPSMPVENTIGILESMISSSSSAIDRSTYFCEGTMR